MHPLSQATREIMWNVSHVPIFYAVFVLSMAVFGFGVYQRIRCWKAGRSDDAGLSELKERLLFTLKEVFSQKRVRRKRFPGLIHVFVFYSFLVLLLTTTVVFLDYDFGTAFFRGLTYVFLTIAAEIGGVFVLLGALVALWRRHVRRPPTLEAPAADTVMFSLLALIIVTGFAVEGLRIDVAGDPWREFSFVGNALSGLASPLDPKTGAGLHAVLWWTHSVLVFLWIAAIPYTRFLHILTLPTNAFLAKRKPAGELARVDLDALLESEDFDEEGFRIGIDTTRDLTWKQRLDGDACVVCGRCEEGCPAVAAGQSLSPKKLIVSMRDMVHSERRHEDAEDGGREIVGNAFDADFLWQCLTCLACTQECPAFITHVDTLLEVRRNEVTMKGKAGAGVSRTLRAMETQGNPFGSQITRGNWVESLGVPILGEGDACDVLYWVGCLTTFDEDKRRIAEQLIELLGKSGIDFALLGKAEVCCGDPARVCGAENLFQTTAKSQVEALNRRKFKKILVSCPHCYNALKNEYPQFGGHFDVVHHSEFLRDLLRSGELSPAKPGAGRTVYHDPCYLGRYQGIYDAPREVVRRGSDSPPVEMERCRERSFCCGGGGGHFWMETKEGERIDTLRIQQVMDSNADTLVTGCPYCFHMLSDAIKAMKLENEIRIVDLVTHVTGRNE
jgi:Fe-S oxidoreductase/nitrate reductase gamma subunit